MDRFYVYAHFSKTDGAVFYIGKGTGNRYISTNKSRSVKWREYTKLNGWYSVILYDNLTEIDALSLENEMILRYKPVINKVVVSKDKPDISTICDNFKICEESNTGLAWVRDNGSNNPKMKRKAGDPAGSLKFNKNGSPKGIEVFVNRCVYQVTHVIWYLYTKEVVSVNEVIDHIDGNPHNNSIRNLRKITKAENARNRKISSSNSEGYSGISRMNNGWGKDYFQAQITKNFKRKLKYFSITDLGEELAFKLACEWREKMIAELNEQGAGYTERHGT